MRLEIRITGKGDDDKTAYQMDFGDPIPFGRDDPKVVRFVNSIAASLRHGIVKGHRESVEKGLLTEKDARYFKQHRERGDFAKIVVDGWVESRKGKPVYFCRIANDENGCSVRTANALPIVTRYVWGIIMLLKRSDPPKGFECLKNINVIKKFFENQNAIDRVVVTESELRVVRKD